jgi:hypothetical protein
MLSFLHNNSNPFRPALTVANPAKPPDKPDRVCRRFYSSQFLTVSSTNTPMIIEKA